jgi:hypothetical protein
MQYILGLNNYKKYEIDKIPIFLKLVYKMDWGLQSKLFKLSKNGIAANDSEIAI